MSENHSPWKDWGEPATKGDVATAMIWTHALTSKLFSYMVEMHHGDSESRQRALEAYSAESKEFLQKLDEIAGRVADGE